MSDDEREEEWWLGGERPSWRDLLAAIAWLTALPVGVMAPVRQGTAALFYPIVGLAIGACWALCDRAAVEFVPAFPRALLVLGVWLVATGGRYAAGVARTCAAVVGGNRQRGLESMAGPALTLPGCIGMLGMLAAQLWSLVALDRLRLPALLYAPMLAAWSVVVLVHGSRAARTDGRRVKYAPAVSFREFAVASVITFGVLFSLSQAVGILVGVVVGAAIVGIRVGLHGWLDGLTEASVRASADITLTLTLAVFAAFPAAS
ncbi:MAG: adenosylcobinamide-GDP ribazoletransferase [Deltaproteobacteria bacterium]|nr:adenosylcobinamide-GDP ribazoletransferase [Deltaproteobacteria bacterium]MBI3390218.1 adenosylcobinamide-GDP ribazoletransferase [Deltaproteobacteria bacterium]